MPFTVTMPKLSPTMEEGTIAKWHKKEGDYVASGELLLEIATDKATIEHNALDEGWLRKILVREQETATLNQPIAIFTEAKEESIENYAVKESAAPATPKNQQAEEKLIVKEATAPAGLSSQPAFVPEPPLPMEQRTEAQEGRFLASPLAKRLAKERGLDLSTAKGTGPGGRITSKDLDSAQPTGLVTFGRQEKPALPPGSYQEIPLSPMRKTIGRRLQEAKSFIPHFYIKQQIDAEPLVALREQLKSYNLQITYNDMVIRAAALALREHPNINCGFNSVNQTIIQFNTIDISIAVNLEEGLITPIIRYADYKNLGQISLEMRALGQRARTMKLESHEYKGGSFCISNLGMFGITEFTAVLNPPQAAILAVGGIIDSPVVKANKVVAGKSMALTLSLDHRVIDGTQGAQFLKTLQKILENPVALTL